MEDTKKKKLNIAMVCDPITDYVAGSFVSTRRFSEMLVQRGHTVIFIAARSPVSPKNNVYKNIIRVYRFFSILLPKTEGKLYLAFPTIGAIKKILRDEKIDVVHILIPTPEAVISMKAAEALHIPIVAHSHTQPENLFLHLPKIFFRDFLNRIFNKYLSWLYHQTRAIIYPSEFAKRLLIKLNTDVQNIIISNGVDTTVFKKIDPSPFFDAFHLSRGTKNILYVGRLHPEKSVDTLIRAMPLLLKQHSDIRIYIVGEGHQDTELKALAAKLGVQKEVIFFGQVSDHDLLLALNACDIFVLPSLAELEGMVVLEVMAVGKPIIIANAKDSASTYFVENNGFLFEPENENDLAGKIKILLDDDNLRGRMGQKSLEKSKQYDIRESVLKLENLYYSVL